ncbi:efflux transporter periplasmic adaptor subunit [Rhodoplanes elegans]|uniref:Efflux transporter periplasmic adaptor subunit n=2 Tax=Rhodoplanes elegans TaxID=29408 RepID=A0A327KU29_9BRAD|nr:efflux transporter periplasmic adaptor subunit [Rhodoplanes elegans]RAI41474.1 efflux transporter periplasmic adaptor subunit [Rhodoplanes elegans]
MCGSSRQASWQVSLSSSRGCPMSRSPSPSAKRSWRLPLREIAAPGIALIPVMLLAACGPAEEVQAPEPRPVRTVTIAKREAGDTVALTGRIAAEDVAALGFRIAGRVMERPVNVGDRVGAGQVIARLEPQNETNAVRSARADLAAARAALTQARNHFERQETLLAQGWTTRALFDQAKRERDTAQARVDAAEAQLETADDLLGFTVLKADAPGVVTTVGAEPGEVVQAGQAIVRLARQGGRDAVFEVPAQVLRTAPPDSVIAVSLTDDPAVTASGRVREVAPEADPVTRTFEVKVGLTDPPEAMRLGATVTGRLTLAAQAVIEIPATALTRADRQPAVWIVDPKTATVALRNVDVVRFDPAKVAVAGGLDVGEVVVTAGVQALHPGQKVRLLGARP